MNGNKCDDVIDVDEFPAKRGKNDVTRATTNGSSRHKETSKCHVIPSEDSDKTTDGSVCIDNDIVDTEKLNRNAKRTENRPGDKAGPSGVDTGQKRDRDECEIVGVVKGTTLSGRTTAGRNQSRE